MHGQSLGHLQKILPGTLEKELSQNLTQTNIELLQGFSIC